MSKAKKLLDLIESYSLFDRDYFKEPREILKLISKTFNIPYKWAMEYDSQENYPPKWETLVRRGKDAIFFSYTPSDKTLTIQVPVDLKDEIENTLKKAKWAIDSDSYQNSSDTYKFTVKVK